MKGHNVFGLVYHRTKDLQSDADAEMLTVSASITSGVRRGHPTHEDQVCSDSINQ